MTDMKELRKKIEQARTSFQTGAGKEIWTMYRGDGSGVGEYRELNVRARKVIDAFEYLEQELLRMQLEE